MIERVNPSEIYRRIEMPNGNAIVLLDRLAKTDLYSKEECARNILRVDAEGHVRWRVSSQFDAEGDPFTQLHNEDEVLTGYRWDGGTYAIDAETGVATPLRLER